MNLYSKRFVRSFIVIMCLMNLNIAFGQEIKKHNQFDISLQGTFTNQNAIPFWMRSNQFGSIPLNGPSGSVLIRANKDLDSEFANNQNKDERFKWGYGLEFRGNLGNKANFQLIEANLKFKYFFLEGIIGRNKHVMGLNGDSTLSSGNFSVSGNALGVPMVDFRIKEYYRLPILDGLISLKGNFANGYMGKQLINPVEFIVPFNSNQVGTFLHQKSLYGRIGKDNWKLQLFGGINHQVQFGNEKKIYGDDFNLNFVESLWKVFWGKAYKNERVLSSKIGNHQGSIDLGLSYDFGNIEVLAYRQNIYDVGAISKLANIKDGLNGITLTNKLFKKENKSFDWNRILVEFFYSKDQAGYPWSKPTKSGDENYYNNYYYTEGWSYKGLGIGTPLIVPANLVKPGQANDPIDYFISNRVVSGHLGFSGELYDWNILSKITISKHHGTFATSQYGRSTGDGFSPPYKDQFIPVTQFSSFLQAEKALKNNLHLGFSIAWGNGNLLYNGLGGQISLRKSFFN